MGWFVVGGLCFFVFLCLFVFKPATYRSKISGNEKADSAAKSALNLPRGMVGYTDIKHHINQYILSTCRDEWNVVVANKLHSVKSVLEDWQSSYRRCRKDEIVLCRTRIGHTHLTEPWLCDKDPPPQCEQCQCTLTVHYILVECNSFAEKEDLLGERDEEESFRFNTTLIVLYLKECQFYTKF